MTDSTVGDPIESIALATDPVRILRFGAATHNAHRIHYDTHYPTTEGLDGPVVMAQLQGTLFYRAAERAASGEGRVVALSWQNRGPAYVGETLTVTGVVVHVDGGRVTLALEEHTGAGILCATGTALVEVD